MNFEAYDNLIDEIVKQLREALGMQRAIILHESEAAWTWMEILSKLMQARSEKE